MPRKRKKALPESPATEPTPLSEPLSAVMDRLPPPDRQLPAPEEDVRILPEEKAEPPFEPGRFAAAVRGMQPVPDGFRPVSTFKTAGIRVNKSHDRGTVAIQFDEDHRAIRGGPNSEVELLAINGFSFEPARRQWERRDPENPGVNIVTAQRFGQELAEKRTGREIE